MVVVLSTAASSQELFGSDTGMPMPRFVSLASERVNVRTGPGREYPIRWVFTRPGLPLKVIDEAENWRKIEDYEGEQGWIYHSLLSGERRVLITGEIRDLLRTPSPDAIVVARIEPLVLGNLLSCESSYCFVSVDGRRGWLSRDSFFGVLENERP